MFDKYFTPAPSVRVLYNIGCLMDIPTGAYVIGKHGESILNGGVPAITGVGGRGNTFKSVITFFMMLQMMARYQSANSIVYDTEATVTIRRLYALAMQMPELAGQDLEETMRLFLSDNTVMVGNEWFDKLRAYGDDKFNNKKQLMKTTPFLDPKTGGLYKELTPTISVIDSLSMFLTDSVDKIYEKNQIGDSGANTDSLRGAAAKSQMIMQLPTLTAKSAIKMFLTMHVGDQHQLDPYAPKKKQLTFMKGDVSFKHVPQKITFLTNNLWVTLGVQVLQNKGTKAPEYPKNSADNLEGDTDLQVVTLINTRAKSGPTGLPFELVISQSEGVLVGLTEFHYIKSFDRFGIGGNDRTYYLELLPDLSLSRTTVRGKIDENPRLRRALEITSELCQMRQLWDDPEQLYCTPKELYEGLKAKGYDWERLLDTRGYWVFEEEEAGRPPFLSTMDLCKMLKGTYHPWWYGDLPSTKS